MRPLRSPEARLLRALAALPFLLLPFAPHAAVAQPKPAPTLPAGPKPGPRTARPPSASTAPRPAGPRPAPKPAPSATSDAAATPDAAPSDAGDEVGHLYTEGYAAFQNSDYARAEQLLTKAWALSRSFDVAATLGSAKLELGKHREAAQYLSFALRNALPSTRASVRDRIKRDLDGARGHLATIKLNVSLVEAKIAVDGAAIDPLFLGSEIYVDPGKRTFEATADGYTPATSAVEVKAGEVQVVTLKLERTSTPKGVPTAAPTAQSTPWPAAVLGGAGGVALIAGAVLIGAAESSKTNAHDLVRNTLTPDGKPTCPRQGPGPSDLCDQVRAAAANADTFGNVGLGMFVGAGVLLASATAYMLFFHTDPPPGAPPGADAPGPTSQIVPVVGTGGGGVVWRGTF